MLDFFYILKALVKGCTCVSVLEFPSYWLVVNSKVVHVPDQPLHPLPMDFELDALTTLTEM